MRSSTRYSVIFFAVLLLIYWLLLDTLAKPLFEDQASAMYGAEVTVESVKVSPLVGKITLFNLQVADRSNAMRNLAEAERAYIDIHLLQLAQDKIELESLDISGFVAFTDRTEAANILRPLVPADSDLAKVGLPDFKIGDIDALLARQRQQLDNDISQLRQSFINAEGKWLMAVDSLPSSAEIAEYQRQLDQLSHSDGNLDKPEAVLNAVDIQKQVEQELNRVQGLRQEFDRDVHALREQLSVANSFAQKHTDALVHSLGLSRAQTAQLANQLLRGQLGGILQQVLAPIAYSTAGQIDSADAMPIHIEKATVSGQLLGSAPGLEVKGHFENFTWPLDTATKAATLELRGSSPDGGSLSISATIDHRNLANDSASVTIENLTLKNMLLQGHDDVSVTLIQTSADVHGQLAARGTELSGDFVQQFANTMVETTVAENASAAARLIALTLESSAEHRIDMAISGTVSSPALAYTSDLDAQLQSTILNALEMKIGELKAELQNRISSELGPEINSARERITQLGKLESSLQASLARLNQVAN